MPEYRVEWSVEVEADDRQEAARLALAIQQSGDRSLSGVFNVWGEDDPDHPFRGSIRGPRGESASDEKGAIKIRR